MPSPGWARDVEVSAWLNRSKTWGRKSGGMPRPVSETRVCDLRLAALERHLDAPAARRELDGVRQEVPDDLLQAIGVAGDRPGVGIQMSDELEALGVDRGPYRVQRRGDHGGEVDRTRLDPELPGHDPGHVQEVLDHPGLGTGVPLDHLEGVGPRRLVERSGPEQVDPAEDRVERGAELVRERGDELVLAPGGGLDLAPGGLLAL